nr:GspE/PulE family protein [Bisgaardia hudsonensis]
MNQIAIDINGISFEITENLWQKNQQQYELLLRYLALPLKEDEFTLWLGIESFANLSACETFSFLTGKIVEPVLLSSQHLKSLLKKLTPKLAVEDLQDIEYASFDSINVEENIEDHTDEPIIHLLNQIFESALKKKVSDIHLEPQKTCLQVRFRVDGVLQIQKPISLSLSKRIISRLKLLAKLDISETRLPQDGRFYFKTTFSDTLDFRLSTLPTYLGEKVVLRVQQNKPTQLSFSELGMTEKQQEYFQQALSQPQGLILVTGPTGSGKSISLYTALEWLNNESKHILTAEDPIEIELQGIIQSQINAKIGLDFSRLLRTFLRQDPDIIMLGEIRDEETAEMALRAAQTGHLVLSTLHTNDAQSAISRLQQLGIKQHEIDNSLLLVVAQRLVRKICLRCNKNFINKSGQKKDNFCDCYQGYKGRIGVYQFLNVTNENHKTELQIDYATLRESALEKIATQLTDLAEINRVLGT